MWGAELGVWLSPLIGDMLAFTQSSGFPLGLVGEGAVQMTAPVTWPLPSEPLSSVSSLEVHFDLLDLTELTDMSDQELAEVFADSDDENQTTESPAGEANVGTQWALGGDPGAWDHSTLLPGIPFLKVILSRLCLSICYHSAVSFHMSAFYISMCLLSPLPASAFQTPPKAKAQTH